MLTHLYINHAYKKDDYSELLERVKKGNWLPTPSHVLLEMQEKFAKNEREINSIWKFELGKEKALLVYILYHSNLPCVDRVLRISM